LPANEIGVVSASGYVSNPLFSFVDSPNSQVRLAWDIETDSLDLRQLSPDTVDVFELYELFAAGSEGVEAVFEYVPQEPYETVKDARERLEKAESRWADRESA
jgi:hypothetical protein